MTDYKTVLDEYNKWRKTDEYTTWYNETLDIQDNKCYYCKRLLTFRINIDHAIPISNGGTNDPNNLVIACWACNMNKAGSIYESWRVPELNTNKDETVIVRYYKESDRVAIQLNFTEQNTSTTFDITKDEAYDMIELLTWATNKLEIIKMTPDELAEIEVA